jgi:hypothetical protein
MAHRKGIQVVCPDCGGRAEVRLEASGTENYVIHSDAKCKRNLHGVSIAGCPGLIGELLQASLSLRLKERHEGELVRKKTRTNGATG